MRVRPALAAAACAAGIALCAPLAPAQQAGVSAHLVCAAPGDAAAIDAMLAAAGSPLAGEGATFVREGVRVGVDPRALVAIAAHETLLATYEPADRIRNAFGLGPGWEFPAHGDAIARAATALDDLYLPEGRVSLPDIGAKWAPVGADNDPTGLNRHWTAGVGTYYRALGGDPERPILLDAQAPVADCATGPVLDAPAPAAAPEGAGDGARPARPGPAVVTAWGGRAPALNGTGPAAGADPATGAAATVAGFVFPLALPRGTRAAYGDEFAAPGAVDCAGLRGVVCAVRIDAAPGTPVVAAAPGVLERADADDREEGIAAWLATDDGRRIGYGALTSYGPGIQPGARVAAGRLLGTSPGTLRVALEAGGTRINPFPLLAVTRAPVA